MSYYSILFILYCFWENRRPPRLSLEAARASKGNFGGMLGASDFSRIPKTMNNQLSSVSVAVFDESRRNRCGITPRTFSGHRFPIFLITTKVGASSSDAARKSSKTADKLKNARFHKNLFFDNFKLNMGGLGVSGGMAWTMRPDFLEVWRDLVLHGMGEVDFHVEPT